MSFEFPKSKPPAVNLDVNIKIANDQWKRSFSVVTFMTWFYHQVRNRGPWDFKQKHPEWENFGNFHYGAVGRGCLIRFSCGQRDSPRIAQALKVPRKTGEPGIGDHLSGTIPRINTGSCRV
jgi:hypothetical protein